MFQNTREVKIIPKFTEITPRNYRNGPRPYRGSGSGLGVGGSYAVGRGAVTRNVIYSHMNTSVEYQQYPYGFFFFTNSRQSCNMTI